MGTVHADRVTRERSQSKEHWPELPAAWADTYATLHMWTQIVGKIALAQAPPLNHSWAVALQLTARGLITRPLPHGECMFTLECDFPAPLFQPVAPGGAKRLSAGPATASAA